jgi:anaerobic selenocysteine-containing dehydrogenase
MTPNRREFLWTMGTAVGASALVPIEQIFWAPQAAEDVGWAPGIEEWIRSACLVCPARCGVTGRVVDGRLVRLIGNPLHPMSRGGVCPRGVAGVQMLYHPERLASPLVRVGERGSGEWRQVSHEEALTRITKRLQGLRDQGRPQALAAVGGYAAGTMQDVWRQFLQAFGSPNYVVDGYGDGTDAVMAAMHGVDRYPSYDLESADMVVSFGAALFESWWSPLQAFTAFGRLGTNGAVHRRFVQVDHRFSRTAAHSDAWVGVKPRTHAVLALGMAYVILRDRLFDEDFLAEHVSGFDDFTDVRGRRRRGFRSLILQRYRTEEASAITGVSVERITEVARAFAMAERPVAVVGSDVTLAPDGLLAAMGVQALNILTGSINRPGGVLFGQDPPLAPLAPVVPDSVSSAGLSSTPVSTAAPPIGAGDPVTRFAEAAAGGGSVEVLMIHGTDPLGTSHRADLWERVLAQTPYVVSFSPFMDETTRYADVVLPDLLPYERWQDAPTPASYPYPVWGLNRPMVAPHEGSKHTGEVIFALARTLGGTVAESLPYDTFEGLLKLRAQGLFEARRGRALASPFDLESQRKQEERGWWLATHDNVDAFWSELVERGGWVDLFHDYADPDNLARTDSGRIDLIPNVVVQAIEAESDGLRLYGHGQRDGDRGDKSFPFRLLPYRVSTLASDTLGLERWMAEQPSVLPDTQWRPWVAIAPVTAQMLELTDGTAVHVVSRRGRYRARVSVSPGVAPLTVSAPYGLRHPDGEAANPLRLLEVSSDPLTGIPSWFTTFVRLEQA